VKLPDLSGVKSENTTRQPGRWKQTVKIKIGLFKQYLNKTAVAIKKMKCHIS
jgi:hypothetical protein